MNEYYLRGDSACHEHELIDWLRDEKRTDGPQGFIGFGVSARMSPALRHAVEAVPGAQWEAYGKHDAEVTRECADVMPPLQKTSSGWAGAAWIVDEGVPA